MNNKHFYLYNAKKINIIFSLIFILLVFVYIGAILLYIQLDLTLLRITLLFITSMIMVGVAWLWFLRRQISSFMKNLNDMVDGAIHGREKITHFEETSLSSIEHKLIRYIEIAQANEQNLETEKNKIKGLISDISHQTKTPLSNIMLFSQLLTETPELPEDTRQLVEHIKSQSDKLDWLIHSLIKLSRLESGMIAFNTGTNPVIQTITRAISQVYSLAESKYIEIHIDCDPLITAEHDLNWTSEALFNLLENAVKYTESSGMIHISVESNEMFTRIDISDTGIGIPVAELEHIFKRFYRGNNAHEFEGVGIGLFLAREIVTAQGGFIKVTSVLGEGTLFSVFLPQL